MNTYLVPFVYTFFFDKGKTLPTMFLDAKNSSLTTKRLNLHTAPYEIYLLGCNLIPLIHRSLRSHHGGSIGAVQLTLFASSFSCNCGFVDYTSISHKFKFALLLCMPSTNFLSERKKNAFLFANFPMNRSLAGLFCTYRFFVRFARAVYGVRR